MVFKRRESGLVAYGNPEEVLVGVVDFGGPPDLSNRLVLGHESKMLPEPRYPIVFKGSVCFAAN